MNMLPTEVELCERLGVIRTRLRYAVIARMGCRFFTTLRFVPQAF